MSVADARTDAAPEAVQGDAARSAAGRRHVRERLVRVLLPASVLGGAVLLWHLAVTLGDVPHYILPGPGLVLSTVVADWPILGDALIVTLRLTLVALLFAVAGGVTIAVLFTRWGWIETSFFPYAVILQVTPVVAIAPLLQIYLDSAFAAALACAWIVAFFPILSNTAIGLRSADHGLRDLFEIYGADGWQRLRLLEAPSALPFFLGGLRISGGLALIGAVVAEFVIGRAGTGLGLASTLLEASYRLNMPRLYAALLLISALGIAIFAATSLISWLALRRWHESAVGRP